MFCSNCGTKLPDGSAFCSKCGAKIEPAVPSINTQVMPDAPMHIQPDTPSDLKPKKKGLPKGAIIGIIIGGILLLTFIIIGIVTFVKISKIVAETSNMSSTARPEKVSVPAGVTNEEAYKGYRKFLKKVSLGNEDELGISSYYLYDMNGDGVDELIACIGTAYTDIEIYIASYKNGDLIYFDDIDGSHSAVYGDEDGGIIIHYFTWIDEDSGEETAIRYEIIGTELYDDTVIPTQTLSMDDDDISDLTEYGVQPVDLISYDINDLSPLGGE